MNTVISRLFLVNALIWIVSLAPASAQAVKNSGHGMAIPGLILQDASDTAKRKEFLEEILKLLPRDLTNNGHVSFLDKAFKDWLARTGELPPDFDKMPSIPYLPNPLILDEGRKNIPISSMKQWAEKRRWMKKELQYYITGTFPPVPENLQAKVLSEKRDGDVTIRQVELTFGPDGKAKMTLELMIPVGKGPFPTFMTQWEHKEWAQIAVRRGYIGCIYAGCDLKDDTENYSEIWAGKYDFSRLMRRAYGASRVIDYLLTLPLINKKQIGIAGHSRNGKQSLWAAAFDERIGAVISSSGGTGGEVPFRYSRHKYGCEDIALLSCAQPSWLHPRLRFFTGRENKLPVDQNLFMALIAPRGLMLSSSRRESDGNPWGIEQAYDSTLKVYKFLGALPNYVSMRLRDGKHGTSTRDIEDYVDFFDYIFGRSNHKPINEQLYSYSFEQWTRISGEKINPVNYPVREGSDLLIESGGKNIHSIKEWIDKKTQIQKTLMWILGDEPPKVANPGPLNFKNSENRGEDYYGNFIARPEATLRMGRVNLSPGSPGDSKPGSGFGDFLYGYLYYPKQQEEKMRDGTAKLPVIIYLHKYDYSQGFFDNQGLDHDKLPFIEALVDQGYAVLMYDMTGFGNRIEEGTRFYQRYPHWSKMGKCVTDLEGAVDALENLNFIDSTRISVLGYSLGATVGLYGAALDNRIASVVSVCGFTPMRTDTREKGTEGIKAYSHLNGLLPKLGFFVGHENRIPYDFDEILAAVAPRPLLVIAPVLDEDATVQDVSSCITQAKGVYQLYGVPKNIQMDTPSDYNRFSEVMQKKVLQWFKNNYGQ